MSMQKRAALKAFKGAIEIKRSAVERGALALSWDHIRKHAPAGDGHPVLVIPGFITNDRFTAPLRDCIAAKGYAVYGWDGGFNLGLDAKSAHHMRERLEQIYKENGGQKISLVGHSLGGIFARELAREFPHMVRGVITLGTPFGGLIDRTATPGYLSDLYTQLNPKTAYLLKDEKMAARWLTPPPVPTTSVFSRTDETVQWKDCLNPAARNAENIEIHASHAGIPFNPAAINVVLDRLAQPEGAWAPFRADSFPGMRLVYPQKLKPADLPAHPQWNGLKSQQVFKNLLKKKPNP